MPLFFVGLGWKHGKCHVGSIPTLLFRYKRIQRNYGEKDIGSYI